MQAALVVAMLNIQLPLYLGNIINILTKFTQNSTPGVSFMAEMRDPALKLVGIYVAQVKELKLFVKISSIIQLKKSSIPLEN